MAARTRSRILLVGAAVAALLAPLASVVGLTAGPATAAVGPRPHEVGIYKVEQHVDLSGEYPDNYSDDVYLSCDDGDYALDGMWRTDHVDQPSGELDADSTAFYNDERDVIFYTSVSVSKSRWLFRFENFADGNAQVKLWITCIRRQTEQTAGHQHDIVLSSLHTKGWGNETAGDHTYDYSQCGPHEYAVAPSFDFYAHDVNWMFRSYASSDGRGWSWAFIVHDPGTALNVGFRCLSDRVGNAGSPSHSHSLPITWRPAAQPLSATWLDHGTQEKRYSCDDGLRGSSYQDHKAVVGGFYIFDPHHSWYLGMDPRPKTRAFKFLHDGSGDRRVDIGALCVRSRTGKQVRPF